MTNKEFEDKKQALRELVYKTDRSSNNLVPTTAMRIILTRAINKLQPPKPPTCATCEHCEHHEIDCGEGMLSDCYRCLSDKLDWNMLPYIEEPANFGCIHHSDYGDTE